MENEVINNAVENLVPATEEQVSEQVHRIELHPMEIIGGAIVGSVLTALGFYGARKVSEYRAAKKGAAETAAKAKAEVETKVATKPEAKAE